MKKIVYSLMLLLMVTGCTAINEFNKKLEDFHKSLPVYSSGSSSSASGAKEIINLNVATRGLGKFENAKIVIVPNRLGSKEVSITGYYVNTSKSYQEFVAITADVYDRDGDRVASILFKINDIRPGERKNISKANNKNELNMNIIDKDHRINDKSWKFEVF
ncbi:MAG: FxLYD domain-containing protein [Fusobacterium gastrosuis]|uniref:FxLYD domain-containing protein n=1 Tax=Fusobacterium gastrosuis TaxID=1755100 RepID=UPI0029794384|nr:FxLYD domain-containing protein [Fusobacteriaceae bacterium]MDY4011043.1 FxLYD domain-containing protein [Fusobacterium gastrosuis]MDY5714125.1 FxLYD domain-containing protein [Fusobacterium gastrosuis]